MQANRLVVAIASVVVLAASAAAVAPAGAMGVAGAPPWSRSGAVFQVGAAAVDVTPPLASSGSPNPAAACATPAQLAQYDGPHLLSLEEPYIDSNHNGIWDTGEPFVDCPTPLADGGTAPPDQRWDGIMLGGGDGGPREPTAVLDQIWARTIVVRSGSDHRVAHQRRQRGRVRGDLGPGAGQGPRRRRARRRHHAVQLDPRRVGARHHRHQRPQPLHVGRRSLLRAVPRRPSRPEHRAGGGEAAAGHAALRHGPPGQPGDLLVVVPVRGRREHRGAPGPLGARRPGHLHPGQLRHPRRGARLLVRRRRTRCTCRRTGTTSPAPRSRPATAAWPSPWPARSGSVEMPQVYPAARELRARRRLQLGRQRRLSHDLRHRLDRGALRLHRCRPRPAANRSPDGRRLALSQGADSQSGGIDVATKRFFVPLDNALFGLGSQIGVIAGKTAYLDGQVVPRDRDRRRDRRPGQRVPERGLLAAHRRRRLRQRAGRAVPLHLHPVVRRSGRRGHARSVVVAAAVDHGEHEHAVALRGRPGRRHDRLHVPAHQRGRRTDRRRPRPPRRRPVRVRPLRRRRGGRGRRRRPGRQPAGGDHAGAPRPSC